MEKKDNMRLYKIRGDRKVLTAGFKLYTENFRRLFKASWIMALVYAMVCGCTGTLAAIKIPALTVALLKQLTALQGIFIKPLLEYSANFIMLIVLSLLSVVMMALASATILAKLKEHQAEGAISIPTHWFAVSPKLMWRTLKGVIFTGIIIAVPYLLILAMLIFLSVTQPETLHARLITISTTMLIITVIIAVLALPLFYVLMKYIMEAPCSYWRTMKNSYGTGLSYWGTLFLVFFVSTLVVTITGLVVMMPAHILNIANQTAHLGLLMGDPLGMPEHITLLTYVTFTLCCFIQFYVSQVMLVHNYYVYGAIEEKTKDISSAQQLKPENESVS